ncbi:MAG: chemotaxis protein CheW [Treponema sp.]|nr:chemotaxis protein CheW [Treponema sp.]
MSDIAEKTADTEENANTEKYLIFSIIGRLFSFPSKYIGEIALFDTVYPLPLMPPYVPGVINRYSVPYALFDIGLLLFNVQSQRNKVLVLKDEIDRISLIIDDVKGFADISEDNLFAVESDKKDSCESISAFFNWEDADVFVLDMQKILSLVRDEAV